MRRTVSHPTDDEQTHERSRRTHFSIRINMFFFATFLLFSALIVKLAFLQFVEGKTLSAQEQANTKKDITISPIRGNIYDLDGYPIAYTTSAQSLFYRIVPGQTGEQKIALARKLADLLAKLGDPKAGVLDAAEVIKRMDVGLDLEGNPVKDPSYTFQPRRIKAGLTNREIAYLTEHQDELQGIEIVEESTRVYDEQTIAVQLVGYLRPYSTARNQSQSYLNYYKDNPGEYLNEEFVGFDGLEFLYQDELRGQNGSKTYPVNSKSQIIGQVKITPPEKGHNLFLTLRKDVQLAAENAIANHLAYMKSSEAAKLQYPALGKNAVSGYAVAIEVDTGRVVAMASYPDYDPNIWADGLSQDELRDFQYAIPNGTIRERLPNIQDDKERGKHPSSLVPLGSTIKPLTVMVGLNEGMITPNERYSDPTTFVFGKDKKSSVSNSDKHNYGVLTPATAIKWSANTFMSEMIGDRMYKSSKYPSFPKAGNAIEVWDSYMKKFGLGQLTGSQLPGEYAGDPYYFDTAKRESAQSVMIYASFGQQARYTTLQLAQYASMLANKGKRYRPLFVDRITTYDGQLIRKLEPQLISEEKFPDAYWKVLENGMKEVFVTGFDGVGYDLARKTGTSQQQVAGQLLENAVFIAYAPVQKPKLAVAVVIPEGGFGSWGAAPIARAIFDAYDKQYGLDGVPKGN
ncbi:peptidoglycan D,D-transpeptidase FtsI family protein [Gorillibacterium sp. sgz5001074]|uniref:peptidoglycan D,D-transpeptidase FtsI family protein n=1 Tax=Gorillibacterium sp. sgz5001074 TaxID=3446695 RepID=UPI003F67843F